MNTPTYTAQQLAEQFGLQVHGDGSTAIHGVATLAHAGPGQLTFLANPRYRAQLADSQAGIVVLRADDAHYDYDVKRCRYAEMYREMGLADLGAELAPAKQGDIGEGKAVAGKVVLAGKQRIGPRQTFIDRLFAPDLARLAGQHLLLVFGSLALAVAVGVPLGILAATRAGSALGSGRRGVAAAGALRQRLRNWMTLGGDSGSSMPRAGDTPPAPASDCATIPFQ